MRVSCSWGLNWTLRILALAMVATLLNSCKFLSKKSSVSSGYDGGSYYWEGGKSEAGLCKLKNEMDKYTAAEIAADPELKKKIMSQCIGREVWYKATAGGNRFHTYVSQQRNGILIDWGWVLGSENRYERFKNWGLVNDPGCCTPGQDCQEKGMKYKGRAVTMNDTYGWDYCRDDETLLSYVGQVDKDYTAVDPACKLSKVEVGSADQENSCHLDFGTSAGPMGFRKFPNPRFKKDMWAKIGGWKGYKTRLDDASIEPPFMIGETCGSCHIALDPTNPPKDSERPHYDNMRGAMGNQFIQITELMGSGLKKDNLLHQIALHVRPGIVDTSAVTQDMVNNPGTFNAIINIDKRPGLEGLGMTSRQLRGAGIPGDFKENVKIWVKADARRDCTAQETEVGTCVTVKSGTWEYKLLQNQRVPHVLKGGEDSIGPSGSVQRVYLNIFSCTETCITNHLSDLTVFTGRNSRQTPVDIGQCRKDCPGFRAVEDRVGDIFNFLMARRPQKLESAGAVGAKVVADAKADKEFFKLGQDTFIKSCASCHSNRSSLASSPEKMRDHMFDGQDLRKDAQGVEAEWFGSDERKEAVTVGTYKCRSLHSNHAKGQLWEYYGSETLRALPTPAGMIEMPNQGVPDGRGYYRAISLLSLWAHAPFMHNNAMGPEIKTIPRWALNGNNVAKPWKTTGNGQVKIGDRATVEARIQRYRESMQALLYPETRQKTSTTAGKTYNGKVLMTDTAIGFNPIPDLAGLMDKIGPIIKAGGINLGDDRLDLASMNLGVPKGTSISILGSIRHKQMVGDLLGKLRKIAQSQTDPVQRIKAQKKEIQSFLRYFRKDGRPGDLENWLVKNNYTNCAGDIQGESVIFPLENQGHLFGVDLSDKEKKALINFLITI